MLGIQDPWILVAYLACIASAALCVIYGWVCWNRGEEPTASEDAQWNVEEEKVQEEVGE